MDGGRAQAVMQAVSMHREEGGWDPVLEGGVLARRGRGRGRQESPVLTEFARTPGMGERETSDSASGSDNCCEGARWDGVTRVAE